MSTAVQEELEALATAKVAKDYLRIVELICESKIRIEALKVLEELTQDDTVLREIANGGNVCECLVSILTNPGTDAATTMIWVSEIVANLCMDDECRQKFAELHVCSVFVEALQSCKVKEEKVAASGLYAMSKLGFMHDENIAVLGEHGGCEYVVQAANKFGEQNEIVAGNACSAIVCLARNDVNRKTLLELDANLVVLQAMKLFGEENDEIAPLGFSAMANLAVGLDGEIAMQPNCEVLVTCLKATEDEEVFEKGCIALANIALNEVNRAQLGATLCQVLVDKWKQFEQTDRLAAYACMLVANLAFNNPPNQTRLGKAGAIFMVVAELKDYGPEHETVARNGCLAVGNLAARNSDNLLYMAGMTGLCEVLVDCLKAFGTTNAAVSKNACFAITTLAFNSKDLKEKFKLIDGCQQVISSALENQYQPYALHDVST